MTYDEYKIAVLRTWHPDLSPNDSIKNAVFGLVGEIGEVIEILKKDEFHGVPKSEEKLRKELGDVHYYLTALEIFLNINGEHAMFENVQKLEARYPGGFTSGGGIR
jgi:NTP pyrophosphatase (non-canonical NTP hydrolase)